MQRGINENMNQRYKYIDLINYQELTEQILPAFTLRLDVPFSLNILCKGHFVFVAGVPVPTFKESLVELVPENWAWLLLEALIWDELDAEDPAIVA